MKLRCLAALLCLCLSSELAFANAPLRVAIVGDINGSYGSEDYPTLSLKLRDKVLALKPDLVLSTGDVVAGQKRGLHPQRLHKMWQSFDHTFYQPLSEAGIVWLPVIGNHDGSKALNPLGQYLFQQDRQQAGSYWRNKQTSHPALTWLDKQYYPFVYSVLLADTALVVIDASGAELTATEWQWLKQQLASPAISRARHRLVVGHLPLFSIAKGREAAGERLAQTAALLQLFAEHQVSWYISGHQHAYYPARVKQLNLLMAGGIPARSLLGQTSAQPVLSLLSLSTPLAIQSWDLHTDTELQPDQLPAAIPALPYSISRWQPGTVMPCPTIQKQEPLC